MSEITIKAYAKINFALDILGKREDGYHEIESVMQALELCDDVFVSWDEGGSSFEIELDPGLLKLPFGAENLAYRAAELARSEMAPLKNGLLRIKTKKRIPVAAGCAGGSADGAAVLSALAALWDLGSPFSSAFMDIAARLGADVPFCLAAQNGCPAAFATGNGTVLKKLEPVDCNILLSVPEGAFLSSKKVYDEYDALFLLKKEGPSAGSSVSAPVLEPTMSSKFALSKTFSEKLSFMKNDLAAAAVSLCPRITQAEKELLLLTPRPLAVLVSGSGPAVFAVYPKGAERPAPSSGVYTKTLT